MVSQTPAEKETALMELNRTDLDLRCASQAACAVQVNRDGWRRPVPQPSVSLRARLAGGLVALACRVDPASVRVDGLAGKDVVPAPMHAA